MNDIGQWMIAAERTDDIVSREVSRFVEDGVLYKSMYVTMDLIQGRTVNIFCWLGVPAEAAKCPAVLHIHGGSQTAYLEHVKHWTAQGCVSCSYDWSGPIRNRQEVSDLSTMPGKDPKDEYDPRQSVMLTRVLLAKKMVSWLMRFPEVDNDRVGAYGISWGGSIAWLLNHYDHRLRAVASIYGCGKITAPGRLERNVRKNQTMDEYTYWGRYLDGVSLASAQHAPIFMMAATNDFWGWIDAVCEAVSQVPSSQRSLSFALNQNHHLDQWSASSLDLWMRRHLQAGDDGTWPAMPKVDVVLENGVLQVRSDIDEAWGEVMAVRYCWSWGDFSEVLPPGRYWHRYETSNWNEPVAIAVCDPEYAGYMYADVFYKNGLKVSGLPLRFSPPYLGLSGADDERSMLLGNFASDMDGWHCPHYRTEPFSPEFRYMTITDDEGNSAVGLIESDVPFAMLTRKPADPKWRAHHSYNGIMLRLYSSRQGTWSIVFTYRAGQAGQREWTLHVEASGGWLSATYAADSFKDKRGEALHSLDKVDMITIKFSEMCADKNGNVNAAVGRIEWC